MVYSTISQVEIELQDSYNNYNNYNSTSLAGVDDLSRQEDRQILKVKIATALSFWCGSIQVEKTHFCGIVSIFDFIKELFIVFFF